MYSEFKEGTIPTVLSAVDETIRYYTNEWGADLAVEQLKKEGSDNPIAEELVIAAAKHQDLNPQLIELLAKQAGVQMVAIYRSPSFELPWGYCGSLELAAYNNRANSPERFFKFASLEPFEIESRSLTTSFFKLKELFSYPNHQVTFLGLS